MVGDVHRVDAGLDGECGVVAAHHTLEHERQRRRRTQPLQI